MNALLAQMKKLFAHDASGASEHPQPTRDWHILLSVTLVLIAASVLWNTWFFGQLANDELDASSSSTENVLETYPAGTIQQVFQSRLDIETAYRSTFEFIDPAKRGE